MCTSNRGGGQRDPWTPPSIVLAIGIQSCYLKTQNLSWKKSPFYGGNIYL